LPLVIAITTVSTARPAPRNSAASSADFTMRNLPITCDASCVWVIAPWVTECRLNANQEGRPESIGDSHAARGRAWSAASLHRSGNKGKGIIGLAEGDAGYVAAAHRWRIAGHARFKSRNNQ